MMAPTLEEDGFVIALSSGFGFRVSGSAVNGIVFVMAVVQGPVAHP
jgi:hypothetical protein